VRAVRLEDLGITPGAPVGAMRRHTVAPDLDGGTVEVARGERRRGDGLPDLLGGGPDEHPVDLAAQVVAHRVRASSWSLSATSALACGAVYLSIHRSWIRRMGTGFK